MLSSIALAAHLLPPTHANEGGKSPLKGVICPVVALPEGLHFLSFNHRFSSIPAPAQSLGFFCFLSLHCLYV